jgi:hypothetical protein
MGGKNVKVIALIELKGLNPNSQHMRTAVANALSVVRPDNPNDELCVLSDKIMSTLFLV